MPRTEPVWLVVQRVLAIHDLMLGMHGGLAGLRDRGALESALGRPMHQWHFGGQDDVLTLAAAYGFALAKKNHPFADGNKRTAFVSMATFCEENGHQLTASEPDVVTTMIAVASGTMTGHQLAKWLCANTAATRRRRQRRSR